MRTVPADQVVKDILRARAMRTSCNYCEILKGDPVDMSSSSVFDRELSTVKPFFDYDETISPVPEDETLLKQHIDDTREKVKSAVRWIIHDHLPYSDVIYDIHMAERNGIVIKNDTEVYKVSFRPFVSGLRTTLPLLKSIVNKYNSTDDNGIHGIKFDSKVYGSVQKLAMILCCKGQAPRWVNRGKDFSRGSDDRHLCPCDYDSWQDKDDAHKLLNFIAQAVGDKDPFLIPPTDIGEDTDAAPDRKRTKVVYGCDRAFDVMIPVLHTNGFLNPRILPGSATFDGEHFHCYFDCDNHLDCRICGYDHESHHYYFNANQGGINVGNYSERCHAVSLFDVLFLHPQAAKLKDGDYFNHSQYASMYAEYVGGMLKYDIQNKKFMRFTGAAWVDVPKEVIRADIDLYFSHQLCENMLQRLAMWYDKCAQLSMKSCMEYLEEVRTQLRKRMKDVGNAQFLSGVLTCLEGKIVIDGSVFNSKDDMLHFEDCVLDLNTMTTRQTVPEDFNTHTTGFDYYVDGTDEETARLHDRIITTIFTDHSVRKAAQKVFGAGLSGRPVKHFFVHTDGGGEKAGNNGKTLLLDLHVESLGTYACRPRRELFYKQTSSDSNSATTALLGLVGKRIGVAEELESTKQLNESEIKHWTNGTNTAVAVRQLYQQQYTTRLTCKFHVGANNNKFPKCDAVGDQALKDRLFILPYMSKFANVSRDLPLQRVFVRDKNLTTVLPRLRWDHLMWCIEGFKMYREEGLDYETLPPFMRQFKDSVLVQQSPVYGILCDLVIKATPQEIQSNVSRRRGLDVRAVWDAVMQDKRFRGYMDQSMVEQAFKSVCKGMEGCDGCLRYDAEHHVYSTHHKLIDKTSACRMDNYTPANSRLSEDVDIPFM
jgi:hypothetical protein